MLTLSVSMLFSLPASAGPQDEAAAHWADWLSHESDAWNPPEHPFMANNGSSVIHGDGYMTDTYQSGGFTSSPSGVHRAAIFGLCASHVFDMEGRLWTVCVTGEDRTLHVLDPVSLKVLATESLPSASTDTFSGGGYFYLDDQDRAVIATMEDTILRLRLNEAGDDLQSDGDPIAVDLPVEQDAIQSVLPDWDGNLWFLSEWGVAGYVDSDGHVHTTQLGGDCAPSYSWRGIAYPDKACVANSFAVDDDGGVYLITTDALYRYEASSTGPREVWGYVYETSGTQKPGQVSTGSGTTPTLFGDQLIAFTDNHPGRIQVVVLDRQTAAPYCDPVPVFDEEASATENSLIAINTAHDDAFALIVENNSGYTGPADVAAWRTTVSGMSRIDVTEDGCATSWTSEVAAPSVVPKYSYGTDLIYSYEKRPSGWYFVALDLAGGEQVFDYKVGSSNLFNNHYAPITIGPDGSTYIGLATGLIRLEP